MADKVNMSLDEIIKLSKGGKGRGRGRGIGRGRRAASLGSANSSFDKARSVFVRGGYRGRGTIFKASRGVGIRGGVTKRAPILRNIVPRNIDGVWAHDLFEGTVVNVRELGKLLISNLEYGVSDTDMKQLFSEFGQLRKASVHYDASGRSLGTAEVIFSSKRDAIRAMNQYNTVPLDGRPMKIQIVESSPVKPLARRSLGSASVTRGRGKTVNRRQSGSFNAVASVAGLQNIRGKARFNAYRGRGRGRGGRGGQRAVTLTKEQLDEQLDNYNKMDIE